MRNLIAGHNQPAICRAESPCRRQPLAGRGPGGLLRRFAAFAGRKLREYFLLLLVLLSVKLVWFSLARISGEAALSGADRADVFARRNYLAETVSSGDLSQSTILPYVGGEWELGTLSMSAAAFANIAFDFPESREQSVQLIRGMIELALTEELRKFDSLAWGEDPLESLEGKNGHAGYLGHLNFMIGAYRVLGGGAEFNPLHKKVSEAIARRLVESPYPFILTYPDFAAFTADNTVLIASLRLFDLASGADHAALAGQWVAYTKRRLLDPETGLMVFWVDEQGNPIGRSRGSAVGWNSFYLPFVDARFAHEQYLAMKQHLLVELPLGMRAIREYPAGAVGRADVDSGPVIFGISTSATGFAIAGAKLEGDKELLDGLLRTAETAGFTFSLRGLRRYLLAPLVGDAIMLAMRTARPWDGRYLSSH